MSQIVIPFDHNPALVDANTSYTVPAGKYAIISFTLSVSAHGRVTALSGSDSTSMTTNSNSDSVNGTFRLNSGSVVAVETTTASATATSAVSGALVEVEDYSEARIKIDTVIAAEIRAGASAALSNAGATTKTVRVDGYATANFLISEYNEVS